MEFIENNYLMIIIILLGVAALPIAYRLVFWLGMLVVTLGLFVFAGVLFLFEYVGKRVKAIKVKKK